MNRKTLFSTLIALLLCGPAGAQQNLVELFQKAKGEIKSSSWADALKTLDALDAESQKPGLEAQRKQLEPALALYRGVAFANLGKSHEAKDQFQLYLAANPNAALDSGTYSKKAISAMEDARKEMSKSGGAPSLAAAYNAFHVSASDAKEPPSPNWADGPVRFLLSADEKKQWAEAKDSVARSEFVEKFWAARDPSPGTPENEARREFERRVAFADERFGRGETHGSVTDRGMVFVLLGPPTYAGRKPLSTGEDSSASQGLTTSERHPTDVTMMQKSGSSTTGQIAAAEDRNSGPGKTITDASANGWREVWHYRKELLPAGVPYQQVDFEFVTKKGYGENVLQRDSAAVNTIDTARQKFKPGVPTS
ncbi:MAG TPA: GWxTD domain-containing protein [Thermoanaerobaculia bacterium]|nr:GWxTD domain-containing protein [Thermoanaerobaculia bacterium]HMF10335.1 GWxTD domain-containing protein [Thermoanaerobaculia bacterium]